MKGFEISYKGNITYAAVKGGLLVVHASCLRGTGNLYIGGVDYENQTKVIWYDNVCLNIGDQIDIKFTDITNISDPKSIPDKSIKPPLSKLEMFHILEQYLKNKGLL